MHDRRQDSSFDDDRGDDPIDLTPFEDDFNETEPAKSGRDAPDGTYITEVQRAVLLRSRAGNPTLCWELRILSAPFQDCTLFHNNLIQTRENLAWLKRDLAKCGLKLDRLSDLQDRLGELVGVRLRVRKRTRGEFTNVFIEAACEGDESHWTPRDGVDG